MAKTTHELVLEAKASVTEAASEQVQVLLDQGVTLIDVREPEEFVAGHLPGAFNIPRGVLEFKIASLPQAADMQAPLILYCLGGGRAALSAVQLQKLGYAQVVCLAGGFEAWAAAKLPVSKPAPINFE